MNENSVSHPSNYSITFNRIPNTVFFCQEFQIPGMNINQIRIQMDAFECPIPGDKMTFDDVLTMTILNDEEFKSYQEIHDWMWEMRDPEDNRRHISVPECMSDAILTVRGNNLQVIGYYHFIDCFPISLAGPLFKSTAAEEEIMNLPVSFAYTRFKFTRKGIPEIPTS